LGVPSFLFLNLGVFVRKKINKSGIISVQVIDKSTGRYKVIKTIGSSANTNTIAGLLLEAKQWIADRTGVLSLDFDNNETSIRSFFDSVQTVQLKGIDLLLGKIFDDIGFNKINDTIFKQLVLYRLVYPSSKLKTTEYLYRYQQIDWDENKVYRYLDKLYNTQKELVQQISYEHTVQVLQGKPQIVFYDVTTVYFETEQEDELRKTGFSKEGKHQNPQIVLGLLVSKNGYPLAYDVFDGKKFEGHTLLPIIDTFKTKYHLQQLVVVADAGLLSNANIGLLQQNSYEFIIGARIKNETKPLQQKILSTLFKNGSTVVFTKDATTQLIVSYSGKRAAKDAINRERGLKRLEKQVQQGKLTKAGINNKGYNKYLKLTGDIQVSIDYEKYHSDARWDGLKGYITNSKLPTNEIIENYNQLWQVEKAFRVSKTDLKIRPIYHRLPKRIEAHICLNFVAYKVFKELERQLKEKGATLSAKKAIEIATFIFELTIKIPSTNELVSKTLLKSQEQIMLGKLFNF
jgi:transposase